MLAIGVSAVYAVAAIPLTPALIASHPVLLELLTGSTSSVISAGAYSTVDTDRKQSPHGGQEPAAPRGPAAGVAFDLGEYGEYR